MHEPHSDSASPLNSDAPKKNGPDKWRPSLSMIVALVLSIVLLVPLAGVVFFRVYENELIQQTEAELIAQSAALAAIAAQRLLENAEGDLPLGTVVTPTGSDTAHGLWRPQPATLSLQSSLILPPRGIAEDTEAQVHAAYSAMAISMKEILLDTQRVTLAGFRLTDFNGTVIAGRDEVGMSLKHIQEVAAALKGRYASVLRERIVDNPQPIYSISRGTSVRVFAATPIIVEDRVAGVIYASRTPSNILKEMVFKWDTVLSLGVFVLLIVGGIGFIFARTISRPIRALTSRTLQISSGEQGAIAPLQVHGSRELHALSTGMLDMASKLSERNEYINVFARHVTHELKTPLTAIHGAAELLIDCGEDLSETERIRFLQNIIADTKRSSVLLSRLNALAKADSVQIGGQCSLSELLQDIRGRFNGCQLKTEGDCLLPMSSENAAIIFENLIDNSINHSARHIEVVVVSSGERPNLIVRDDGTGVSAGNAHRIFELFYTTRRENGGTGMGLGIVQAMLKAHGAQIELLDSQSGAWFRISFDA